MTTKILMSDPLVSKIRVSTSQEPFVNLIDFDPEIAIDLTLQSRTPYYSYVRISLAEKLSLAKKYLPKGIRFFIKEGYRPVHIQEMAFQRSLQRVKDHSQNQNADFLYAEASKYVAPPNVAPHPTGGAIDLTLIDSQNIELDLGTVFDAVPHETDNATYFEAENISKEAKQNRQILAQSLQSVGFVNYFTEWWHWSYGDRYWAVMNHDEQALYHPVTEQELLHLLWKG